LGDYSPEDLGDGQMPGRGPVDKVPLKLKQFAVRKRLNGRN